MKRYTSILLAAIGMQVSAVANNFMEDLSDFDKAAIGEVVSAFGKNTNEELLEKANSLMPFMIRLMTVPPLKTIAYVASEEKLKTDLLSAKRDLIKWPLFIGGFEKRMEREKNTEQFWSDLKLFAQANQLDETALIEFAEADRWDDFVTYILES